MGLLLSVAAVCIGVLEVISLCGYIKNGLPGPSKPDFSDITTLYALELEKRKLTNDPSTAKVVTISSNVSIRVQEKSDYWSEYTEHQAGSRHSSRESPILSVPRNSFDGAVAVSPEINICEAIAEAVKETEELYWDKRSPSPAWRPKSPSPVAASKLDVVEKDFWASRSPSPVCNRKSPIQTSSPELSYTPGLRKHLSQSSYLSTTSTPNLTKSPSGSGLRNNVWRSSSPLEHASSEELRDLWKKSPSPSQRSPKRTPSPYPEPILGRTPSSEELQENSDCPYGEEFLRSLDGVKYRPLSRDDKRRKFFRKRDSSSSTSSKASREEEVKAFTSLEEAEQETLWKTSQDTKASIEESEMEDDQSIYLSAANTIAEDLDPKLINKVRKASFEEATELEHDNLLSKSKKSSEAFWND